MKLFPAACCLLTIAFPLAAPAAPRVSAQNEDCAPVEHPGDGEIDFSATDRLIRKQTSCAAAEVVFQRCPHGAMYSDYHGSSVLDQSASVIELCEMPIHRKADIRKNYEELLAKYCHFEGESRQIVAITDECVHNLAVSMGKLVELREWVGR